MSSAQTSGGNGGSATGGDGISTFDGLDAPGENFGTISGFVLIDVNGDSEVDGIIAGGNAYGGTGGAGDDRYCSRQAWQWFFVRLVEESFGAKLLGQLAQRQF